MHHKVLHLSHSTDPLGDLEPRCEYATDYYQWYSHNTDRYFETEEEAVKAEQDFGIQEDEIAISHLNPQAEWDWGKIGGRFGPDILTTNGPAYQCQKSDLISPPEPEVFDAYYYEEEDLLVFRTIYDPHLRQFILNPKYEEGLHKALSKADDDINIYQLDLHS